MRRGLDHCDAQWDHVTVWVYATQQESNLASNEIAATVDQGVDTGSGSREE